jgi:hypothetical protein
MSNLSKAAYRAITSLYLTKTYKHLLSHKRIFGHPIDIEHPEYIQSIIHVGIGLPRGRAARILGQIGIYFGGEQMAERTYLATVAAVCFALSSTQVCQANPMVIDPVEVTAEGAATGIGIDLVTDGAVLILAYLLLKRGRDIGRWAFARHWAVVLVAGLIVDLFLYMAAGGTISSGPFVAGYALLGFLALGAANYLICRRKDRFSPTEAAVVGVFIGILTNPVLFELCLRAAGFRLYLVKDSGLL